MPVIFISGISGKRGELTMEQNRIGNGNEKAVKDFFIARAEQIPASWEAAYEKAKEHNDAARMQTEQVKLDVVREVRAEFDQIWEGAE